MNFYLPPSILYEIPVQYHKDEKGGDYVADS